MEIDESETITIGGTTMSTSSTSIAPYKKNHFQHHPPEETVDESEMELLTDGLNNNTIDARTFLFRSPASPEEIDYIGQKVRARIDEAHAIISRDGYDVYRRSRNRCSHTVALLDPATADVDDGMDTDDEAAEDFKTKQQAASLAEAVVRGSPRRYQTALVELAKRQNTIVNLGTGQGKTLIALLCIRHFAKPAYDQGKQTLFLVPSIALAVQHTTTLMANLPYSVATACNTSTKSKQMRQKLADANIVVATHGAAKDLLMHYGDMFSFNRINLLIVDECHYATGEHGYATILKNFYHRLPKDLRPRVLGLTASPLVNVKRDVTEDRLSQMLEELEQRLDGKLACLSRLGVADSKGRLLDANFGMVANRAEERSIHYHTAEGQPMLPTHEGIGLHESRLKEFKQLNDLYDDLGAKLTSVYSATLAREVSRNRYENETKNEFELVVQHLKKISNVCHYISEQAPDGGRTEKLAVLEQLLEDIIEAKGAANTVGVVFVDRRITALALYDYFRARRKGLQVGDWIRIKDTRWNRRPTDEDLEKSMLSGRKKAANAYTTTGSTNGDKVKIDITTNQFQDVEFDVPELECSIIDNILADAVPDDVDMDELQNTKLTKEYEDDFLRGGTSLIQSSSNSNDNSLSLTTALEHQNIRCDMLVRHSTQIFKYLDKSHHMCDGDEDDYVKPTRDKEWLHEMKKIKDVLDGLRTKRTNVLIATSVVEEGVDVDACSFVIVFDHLRSTKAYIQMKGRARQKNAKFFVFQNITPNLSNPYMSLCVAQEIDQRVREFIESRPQCVIPLTDPVVMFTKYEGDSVSDEDIALCNNEYRAKSGMVDLSSAKSLLNRYTLSIPMDVASRSTRDVLCLHMPQFEDDRLMLPAHIPSAARCVLLPERYRDRSKKEKQNMLALMACVRLHKLHLLSDRLLPLKRKDMQNKLLGVALTELLVSGEVSEQKDPPGAGESNEVYIYTLNQAGEGFDQNEKALGGAKRQLCLITLVPFPGKLPLLHFTHLEIGKVTCDFGAPKTATFTHKEWTRCADFYTAVMNGRWRKRTSSAFYRYNPEKPKTGVLPPYVVGPITKDGEIDWDRIEVTLKDFGRTEEERIEAVRTTSLKIDLKSPRVWCPIYDPLVSYIAYGPSKLTCDAPFPDQLDDVKTYQDYMVNRREFQVGAKSRLFAVQRLWYLPRKVQRDFISPTVFAMWKEKIVDKELEVPDHVLQEGERSPCEGLVAALLPQDACLEAPIADASLYLSCLLLPQILFHMDQIVTAEKFVDYCAKYLPVLGAHLLTISEHSWDDVLESLTAKSCIMPYNYDRLEWLGDAVLKLIHTDALLNSRDLRKWVTYLHEGDLSLLRSAMGSNERLMNAAKSAGLDRFILYKQLGRGQWIPIGLELHDVDADGKETLSQFEEITPGRKVYADVIESLLGLVYVHRGFDAAFDVAKELGITLEREDGNDEPIDNYEPKKHLLSVIQNFLGGVEINRPELIEEAATHPSCIHEDVPCYQRLEWVGDAVLCLYARDWIYNQYTKLHVSEMVILEASIVCNETLAYVNVLNGLQRYLNHRDPSLPPRITEFERSMGPSGRGLWATDPPKSISDMIEAIFGAVHVDGGFIPGQQAVSHVMKPILDALVTALVSSNIDEMKNKAQNMMHPKQFVHELAGGIIHVKAWKEEAFALRKRNCPIWRNTCWGVGEKEGNGSIGLIESFGIDLVGISESSSHVARNRACAIAMEVFAKNNDLIEKLRGISLLLRQKDESGEEDGNTGAEKE